MPVKTKCRKEVLVVYTRGYSPTPVLAVIAAALALIVSLGIAVFAPVLGMGAAILVMLAAINSTLIQIRDCLSKIYGPRDVGQKDALAKKEELDKWIDPLS